MNPVPDPQQLMEAFAAFTAASEQLEVKYEALQLQLARLQGELQTVIEAVPFALWVVGDDGELRFSNRPEGLQGVFMDGPEPWQAGAPAGLRHFRDAEGHEHFMEQEHRPTPSGQIITLRDVTEAHLRAQQASREERLQAMGLMAAELAHEIRNPLGSLALFAGMLVEDLQQQPPQLELAQRLQESVQRLNLLVTNTLTFSRDLAPKPVPVRLHAFWEEARKLAALPEDVAWKNQVAEEACWSADPNLLRQVATNLLQNAVKALDGCAEPRLELRARPELVEGIRHWSLVLEDNGCGIPAENLPRIFDPFYSTFGGGTGLGLAVSHRILVAHGGLLYLESQEGKGTKVHLRMPSAG
ncbi:MAG TPA: ATP-binding protein [Holophaga sp.]|nr:ATP-binding protein [Holophaga sp.]HPS67924.1 ATP-binding protein [Holophaga sp.]